METQVVESEQFTQIPAYKMKDGDVGIITQDCDYKGFVVMRVCNHLVAIGHLWNKDYNKKWYWSNPVPEFTVRLVDAKLEVSLPAGYVRSLKG